MEAPNDFIVRALGSYDGRILPSIKRLATDEDVESILMRIGNMQSFLDLSRCPLLSGRLLQKEVTEQCSSLLYLDISYLPSLTDVNCFFSSLPLLRVLNLSGCECLQGEDSLARIGELAQLEILSLRNSKVTNVAPLAMNLCLRSLDLGCSTVRKGLQVALHGKHRFEELIIDETQWDNPKEVVDVLPTLPMLKYLNLMESNAAIRFTPALLDVNQVTFFSKDVQRTIFFDAVIRDDVATVHQCITSGQNVDRRVGSSDQDLLIRVYNERCVFQFPGKAVQKTIFFLCPPIGHQELTQITLPPPVPIDPRDPAPGLEAAELAKWGQNLAPAAIHLAIFFNSQGALKLLLAAGADVNLPVYLTDISVETVGGRSRLVEDLSKMKDRLASDAVRAGKVARLIENGMIASQAELTVPMSLTGSMKKILSTENLLKIVMEHSIHRMSTGMLANRTADWKTLCIEAHKELSKMIREATLDTKMRLVKASIKSVDDVTFLRDTTTSEILAQQSKALSNRDVPESALPMTAAMRGSVILPSAPRTRRSILSNDDLTSATLSVNQFGESLLTASIDEDEVLESTVSQSTSLVLPSLSIAESIRRSSEIRSSRRTNGSLVLSTFAAESHADRSQDDGKVKLLEKISPEFTWRDHALVAKLIGAPRRFVIEGDKQTKAKDVRESRRFGGSRSMSFSRFGMSDKNIAGKRGSSFITGRNNTSSKPRILDTSTALTRLQSVRNQSTKSTQQNANDDQEVFVLGKKNFWLESRQICVDEATAAMEKNPPPAGRIPLGNLKGPPRQSITEKRLQFLAYLDQRTSNQESTNLI